VLLHRLCGRAQMTPLSATTLTTIEGSDKNLMADVQRLLKDVSAVVEGSHAACPAVRVPVAWLAQLRACCCAPTDLVPASRASVRRPRPRHDHARTGVAAYAAAVAA
jgi:hypothetical protein